MDELKMTNSQLVETERNRISQEFANRGFGSTKVSVQIEGSGVSLNDDKAKDRRAEAADRAAWEANKKRNR